MEDFVTYEQAVKLKELGFNWECLYYYQQDELCENTRKYIDEEEICISIESLLIRHNIAYPGNFILSAPTLAQAVKWLREVKGIYVYPDINCVKMWFVRAVNMKNNKELVFDGEMYDTYEAALSAGIDEALKLIENK